MVRLALSTLLTLTLSTGCSSPPPSVVTKIERVYPAGPPAGACETQPTPNVAGVTDWRLRGTIYAGAAAEAIGQLARCDQWIKGWQAEASANEAAKAR